MPTKTRQIQMDFRLLPRAVSLKSDMAPFFREYLEQETSV